DISGNLPDNPVNSLTIDPSYPNTLYAATDVGPFVTYNGGAIWSALGTGFPIVAVDQIDMDTYHRVLAAGTHGRGAWSLNDASPAAPALVISKADAGVPVGPGSNLDYAITVRNIGNEGATGVTITNLGFMTDTYTMSAAGGTFPVSFLDSTCTTAITTTPAVTAGASTSVCVKVDVPATATDSATSTATITATSTGSPKVSASGTDK